MERVCDLIKGHNLYEITEDKTVLDAARLMVENNIGAVPVVHGGTLIGIFSERDVLKRVVAEKRDPAATKITEVMTRSPITVEPSESLDNCRVLMKQHNFRHLPVCEQGKLIGLLSLRDIMLHDLVEKDGEVEMMRAYIRTNVS